MPINGKRMCTIDGVDFTDTWVGMSGLRASGPGSVGQATLTFEKQAGGLTIRNKQIVRLWEAFNSSGVGVAQRGRWLIGIIDGKATTSKSNIKQWQIKVTDCNILLKILRIDIDDSAAVTIPAGSFASQILALTQAVQRKGAGSVNIEIDATNFVANLVTSGMPAYVAKGKTYGQMLLEICQNAKAINSALRPQFYIGVGNTFGVGDVVGNPVLNVWDGAITTTPVYTFSDTPTALQKYRYGTPKRSLDSTQQATRAQSIWGPDHLPATSADATAATQYPNPFNNHGINPGGNSGHWEAIDPDQDSTSTTLAQAQALLALKIAQQAYPREVYEHGADVPILPGESVTEIDSLEDGLGGAGVVYRVVQVSIDVTSDSDPFYTYTLGSRRLELLEKGEGILAAPAEGDNSPPLAPTSLSNPPSHAWVDTMGMWLQTWTWVNSASRDVDRHRWWDNANLEQHLLHLEGTFSRYVLPGQAYDVFVQAIDTHEHPSAPSNRVTGNAPARPALSPPSSFAQTNVHNPDTGMVDITYTWLPSSDPSVLYYHLQHTEVGGSTRDFMIPAGILVFVVAVAPLTTIHQARIRAENPWTQSVWAPSSSGLADFQVAGGPPTLFPLINPSFEIPGRGSSSDAFWWDRNTSGSSTANRVSSQHNLGSWSMQLVRAFLADNAEIISRRYQTPVNATQYLVVRFAAKTGAGTGSLDVRWRTYNTPTSGSTDTAVSGSPTINTSWAYYEVQVAAPTLDTYSTIGFQPSAGGVTIYLDDVSVEFPRRTLDIVNKAITPEKRTNTTSSKTSAFTADTTIDTYLCDASGGAFTASLPAAATNAGVEWTFKKTDTSGFKITIDPSGSETIDGILTYPLVEKGQAVTLVCNGTGWEVKHQAGLMLESVGGLWLGPEHSQANWVYYPAATFEPAGSEEHQWCALRKDRATYCTLYEIKGYINGGTANAFNYWVMHLRTFTGLVDLQTVPLNTKLWAVNTFTDNATVTFNTQPSSSDGGLELYLEKVGSPGPLRLAHTLYVRHVYG